MSNIPQIIDSDYIRENFIFDDGKQITVAQSIVIIRLIKGNAKIYGRTITKTREDFLTFLSAASLIPKVVSLESETVEN